MKAKLMADRARTQRVGVDSEPQQIFIAEGELKKMRKLKKILETEQNKTVSNGYPYFSSILWQHNSSIYDTYYIVVK